MSRRAKQARPGPIRRITLLSAMESAGAKDMPEDAERRGLGTPATRAGTIEKLVSSGFAERKKAKKAVQLIPTHAGTALITVLPEQLQSPALTAEWEHRLKLIERGEADPAAFMDWIAAMLKELVGTYKAVKDAEVLFPSGREVIGKCPRCGGPVAEMPKGFFCQNPDCKFALWKNSKFFAAKRKTLTKPLATALLKDGRAQAPRLLFRENRPKPMTRWCCWRTMGTGPITSWCLTMADLRRMTEAQFRKAKKLIRALFCQLR